MGIFGTIMVLAVGIGQIEPLNEPEVEPLEQTVAVEEPEALELVPLDREPERIGVKLKYPPGTVLYVNASSLALRTGPKRDAVLVHYMVKDSRVVALDDLIESVPDTIGGRKGHWVYIRQGQHEGYTFDPFLVKAAPGMEAKIDWRCLPGKRVGPIDVQTSYEELQSIFGEANVGDAEIPIGDGKSERGTVIFPNDKERRLFIQWEFYKIKPKAIIVEGTRWRTTKGIGMGARLAELVRANQGPVSFAGFGWDYSGYVMSWRGGQLETDHRLRDDISLYLMPTEPYLPADFDAVQGDREFSSDLEAATKLNLRVNAMTVFIHD